MTCLSATEQDRVIGAMYAGCGFAAAVRACKVDAETAARTRARDATFAERVAIAHAYRSELLEDRIDDLVASAEFPIKIEQRASLLLRLLNQRERSTKRWKKVEKAGENEIAEPSVKPAPVRSRQSTQQAETSQPLSPVAQKPPKRAASPYRVPLSSVAVSALVAARQPRSSGAERSFVLAEQVRGDEADDTS